jgi:phosphatidylinositol kinase/protein kinase (PI-3  family)
LSSFQPIFDDFLAQTENIRILSLFLYDEVYKIREIAISIIGRLKKKNPAEINPFLRDLLLKLLSEIGFFLFFKIHFYFLFLFFKFFVYYFCCFI